ncbi:MAG: glucose-6-phosphate isomerase family protein [candidate division WOR-3 bacterium]
MISISQKAGFKVYLKEDGYLEFNEDILFESPEPRFFSKAKNFFKDPNAKINRDLLYLMYRNVRKKDDDELLIKNDIRYDLTVIFPGKIGDEYIKTIGHYHPFKEGTKVSYPEIYEVIYGQAKMIIQKFEKEKKNIVAVYYIEAGSGDKIVIPAQENFFFGHTTINPTSDFLVLANTQERTFQSDYSEYLKKSGASYYLLNIKGQEKLEKNSKYEFAPPIMRLVFKESIPELCLSKSKPLYPSIIENIRQFRQYLTFPEESLKILSIENCCSAAGQY